MVCLTILKLARMTLVVAIAALTLALTSATLALVANLSVFGAGAAVGLMIGSNLAFGLVVGGFVATKVSLHDLQACLGRVLPGASRCRGIARQLVTVSSTAVLLMSAAFAAGMTAVATSGIPFVGAGALAAYIALLVAITVLFAFLLVLIGRLEACVRAFAAPPPPVRVVPRQAAGVALASLRCRGAQRSCADNQMVRGKATGVTGWFEVTARCAVVVMADTGTDPITSITGDVSLADGTLMPLDPKDVIAPATARTRFGEDAWVVLVEPARLNAAGLPVPPAPNNQIMVRMLIQQGTAMKQVESWLTIL